MSLADLERDLDETPKGGGLAALAADVDSPKDDRTAAGRLYEEYVAKPLARAAGFLLTSASPAGETDGRRGRSLLETPESREGERRATEKTREVVGDLVVPQSLAELGAQAATGGAAKVAKVAKLGKLASAALRTAGAGAGAAAGAVAEGEDPGSAAAKAGGVTALVETAVPVGGKVVRSLPGAKGRIAAKDAARVGDVVDELTSGVVKARTADEMRAAAAGPGRQALGDAKEDAIVFIEREVLGGRPILVPALGDAPLSVRAANQRLSEIGAKAFSKNPLDRTVNGIDQRQLYGQVANQIRDGIARAERGLVQGATRAGEEFVAQGTRRALPPAGGSTVTGPSRIIEARPLTQREGVERTLEAATPGGAYREGAEHVASVRPDSTYVNPRQVVIDAKTGAITTSARPEAPSVGAALWDQTQDKYKKGLAVLKLLERPGAYRRYGNAVQFNTPELQRLVADPRTEALLRNKLGDEGFEKLRDALTRGGAPGTRDQLAWGQGGMLDAGRMVADQRGGFASLIGLLPKTLLPNLTSRYAGRAPYSVGAGGQTIADIIGQALASDDD